MRSITHCKEAFIHGDKVHDLTKSNIRADKLELCTDKLIATHPKIERKGAAHPYTSLNCATCRHLSGSDSRNRPAPVAESHEVRAKFLCSKNSGENRLCSQSYGVDFLSKKALTVPDTF